MGKLIVVPTPIGNLEDITLRALRNLIEELSLDATYALVSDAGTPGISDPGFLLIRACLENNITVESLPGATAFVPALVNSGLPTDKFVFEGFLPQKKGRQTRLKELATEQRTIILYESPYRLIKTLKQLQEFWGNRQASVSRELTKMFEENVRGNLEELQHYFSQKNVKGEIVVIVAGYNGKEH